ncbi:MAG TPA: cation diffusion facilitator family transporter [Candidatus Cloacimonadota bacterium]|nr:cation diffusion facilitator family transporter [Candidatus Cloacimonadota bacterium]HPT71032.1 cation diffusion facilitator family transporter [Candidatus Cloacimonadota bacterium]
MKNALAPDMTNQHIRDGKNTVTINLGLYTNVVLAALKTLVGIFGHSTALLADGVNSISDVTYYIAVKIFMVQAKKPADKEHPYGHLQLESISALVVGAFILTTGIAIFWQSINSVFDLLSGKEAPPNVAWGALVIAVITVITKFYLYFYTNRMYKETMNPALKALAKDHLNDILASIGVTIGISMAKAGYPWVDPFAGAVVAIFIIRTGIGIIGDSTHDLMDAFPDDDFRHIIADTAKEIEGVQGVDEIGIHRYGPNYTLNLTIMVRGGLTVEDGDEIADRVEKRLCEQFGGSLSRVHIHYHPYHTKGTGDGE